jgi:hypothetical protein
MTLFQRRIQVQVDTIQISDLDVTFKVEKSLGSDPNTAEIQVYNLNTDHRGQLQALKSVYCLLLVSYGSDPPGCIFRGDLHDALSRREGLDWITTVRSGDGAQALKGRINKSFKAGTSVETVIREAAAGMGLSTVDVKALLAGVGGRGGGRQYMKGTVLSGSAANELDRVTSAAGLEWSIQDGVLQLLPRAEALAGTAVVLSADTGMIGSPALDSKGVLKAKSLLMPDLFPGRKVQVVSATIPDGSFYRVERITYTGSTFGPEWYCDMELKAL